MKLLYDNHQINFFAKPMPKKTIFYDELTIVLKGCLTYYVNGNKIVLNENDIIFIKSQSSIEREKANVPCEYVSFNYSSKKEYAFPVYLEGVVDEEIKALISLYDQYKNQDGDGIEKKKLAFLDLFLLTLSEKLSKKVSSPTVDVIISYLKNNVYGAVNLKDISETTFYSPVYCSTVFKKHTGKGIIDYFLDLKINEAKKLLIEGVYSLKDISDKLAFSDYNYFSRTFKKRTGYTPFEYRKLFML